MDAAYNRLNEQGMTNEVKHFGLENRRKDQEEKIRRYAAALDDPAFLRGGGILLRAAFWLDLRIL